ncbi:MAG: hypothetical protein GXP58_08785 [Deltaproteobacteria bacterium]|nr:hypothetical protein [Deltaproteobacteria bacterium]
MAKTNPVPGMKRFFRKLTLRCFNELLIKNRIAVDYLSSLLARFAGTDELYKIRNVAGKKLEYLIDFMMEIQDTRDLSTERFSPFREREIKQHIGDYTLFMTGIFRDFVTHRSAMTYFTSQGKLSYASVSDFDRIADREESDIFKDLSMSFEDYAFVLDYMKKVHFKDAQVLGPYRAGLQRLDEW